MLPWKVVRYGENGRIGWLAEHLVKYYSGFNVFLSDVSRHRQPADCAVHLLWMGPRMIDHLQKIFLWSGSA